MEILRFDGSFGEGGGQIIRSVIALSCITKKPVEIENIRKNRKVSGLQAQHLTSLKLLSKICHAEVKGLNIGSNSIKFIPHEVESCSLEENIGTAGSISLLLQAIIPVVATAGKKLKLSIIGGTDVLWSPTSNYTKFVLAEAYTRLGINFSMNIKKRGYYPRGGGVVSVEVFPSKKIMPINLLQRNTKDVRLFCSFSKISKDIIMNIVEDLKNKIEERNVSVIKDVKEETAKDQGSSMLIFSKDSGSIIGSDGLYDSKKGKFSESLSNDFLTTKLGVDYHLADMLVLPVSLSKDMSVFRVEKITKHLETNLYVTSKITGCKYGIGKLDRGYEVRITGSSDTSIQ
ncbi:MAG TPA: RNA 3'-terminal phosphate cyclase [Nitrosopumilaceae archaeon]|nr:RNA 3'-terminal phosphate cyclase [Nitrosopumilaceae archaeon]